MARLCDHWSDPDDGSDPPWHLDANFCVGNVALTVGRGDPSGKTVEASRSSRADRLEENVAASFGEDDLPGKAVEASHGNRLIGHVSVQDTPCAASSVMAFFAEHGYPAEARLPPFC